MDAGKPFSLTAVSYDARRMENTGELKIYDEAVLLAHVNKLQGFETARGTTRVEKLTLGTPRKPNTDVHFIRDIQPLTGGIPMGHPVRIHPRLILFFNGKKVMP